MKRADVIRVVLSTGMWAAAFAVSGFGFEGEGRTLAILWGILAFLVAGFVAAWLLPSAWPARVSVPAQIVACAVGGMAYRSWWVVSGLFSDIAGPSATGPLTWIATGVAVAPDRASVIAQVGWTVLPALLGAAAVWVMRLHRREDTSAVTVEDRLGI